MRDIDADMRCRCNMCMREFTEGEQYEMFSEMERSCCRCCHYESDGIDGHCALGYDEDPDGCEEYDPMDTCPWCGNVGYIQWMDNE